MLAVEVSGVALKHLSSENPGLAELPTAIGSDDAIGGWTEVAAGCDQADVRLVWQLALNADDSDARALAVKRIASSELLARRAIIDHESRKSPARRFAREPHSELRIDNTARKEQILGRI